VNRGEGRVLVLGGGLAGLSTAYHLEDHRPVVLLEKEDRLGGLTRSFRVNDFIFDITGHLLHLRRKEVRDLIDGLIPEGLASVKRRSFIRSHGVDVDYPFQANLHGLPPEVIRDCLTGFIEAHADPQRPGEEELAGASFHDWAEATFGRGIAAEFMLPYNRKLWCRDLRKITADWVSWAVPRPKVEEVVGGALGIANRGLGYNPTFRYPVAGGIEVLPNALADGLRDTEVHCETEVVAIETASRQVVTADGRRWPWDDLVTTLPLPVLTRLVTGLPSSLQSAAAGLQATQVLNVNLGIDRPDVTDHHWTYYPEDRFVFYRVGSPTSFCQASAPAGCSSLYVEVARLDFSREDIPALTRRIKDDLVACGMLRPDDRIVAEQAMVVNPAYVIYDVHRRRAVPEILSWLAQRGIQSIGRYGRWEYGSMEDAIHQGMETAATLASHADSGGLTITATEDPECPTTPASA
jgi:protoporphyrinogen oxidase